MACTDFSSSLWLLVLLCAHLSWSLYMLHIYSAPFTQTRVVFFPLEVHGIELDWIGESAHREMCVTIYFNCDVRELNLVPLVAAIYAMTVTLKIAGDEIKTEHFQTTNHSDFLLFLAGPRKLLPILCAKNDVYLILLAVSFRKSRLRYTVSEYTLHTEGTRQNMT